jgi:hypothetical protein
MLRKKSPPGEQFLISRNSIEFARPLRHCLDHG